MRFIRSRRLAVVHMALSLVFLVAPLWNTAAADVLVLRNGGRIDGTLANREVVSRDPFAFTYISFLQMPPNRAPELLSFTVAEVDYVLLETEAGTRVIDFQVGPRQLNSRSTTGFPTPPDKTQRVQPSDKSRGAALMVFGIGLAALAIAKPFESNWYYSGYTRVNTGNTYNTANYILMGVGGICVLSGLSLIARGDQADKESLSVWAVPGGAGLRKSWGF